MKDLVTYINEAVEFEKVNNLVIVSLVRRENIDLSKLSKEDFIKLIKEDFAIACKEYDKLMAPINTSNRETFIKNSVERAVKYAETKYKRAKYKEKYIENARKNAENAHLYNESSKNLFFDLKPNPGSMSIPEVCIIRHSSTDETLSKAYDEMQKDKYFKRGTGWAFKYSTRSEEKPILTCRPYIDILLDETSREEQKRDGEILAQAIDNFYSKSNYWGD
jgi:hypothetical protein